MANRTVKYATSVHGTNPQNLIEDIIHKRIYESKYWKENCLLLTSALVLEKAVDDIKYVGGVYGNNRPTPFLCLVQKLLQIQPQRDIIYLFIEQSEFKYLRALGAFYLRLIGSHVEIYNKLEPLYKDYRKLRIMDRTHKFSVIHMDELIDNLLREDRVFDLILPMLKKRIFLEDNREIEPYKSGLDDELNLMAKSDDHKIAEDKKKFEAKNSGSSGRYSDRYQSRHGRDYEKRRPRSPSPDDRYRQRHRRDRSRSPAYRKPLSSSGSSRLILGRFKQEEIDNENAIRAKVGLKPLKWTDA